MAITTYVSYEEFLNSYISEANLLFNQAGGDYYAAREGSSVNLYHNGSIICSALPAPVCKVTTKKLISENDYSFEVNFLGVNNILKRIVVTT
jgi:hypothetical protein